VTSSVARRPRDDGFTLLEVLVALVVLSTTVVAALQLFGGGLRLVRTAGDHADAALLASTKLADLDPGPLTEGTDEGTEGAYRWTRRVTLDPSLLPVEPDTPETITIRLARVSVEVRWGQGRRFELATLRAWRIGS
jgi:prepilin-type N-terminal cleavage/methylation domain-containing protein